MDVRYELHGPEIPLRRLAADVQPESVIVIEGVDGPEDNEVVGLRWMQTSLSSNCQDVRQAASVGEELVSLINGAVSILYPELRVVRSPAYTPESLFSEEDATSIPEQVQLRESSLFSIRSLLVDGTPFPYTLAEPEHWLIHALAGSLGLLKLSGQGSRILALIDLAVANEYDYVLLKHAGAALDWATVYKLRDTLDFARAGTLSKAQSSQIGNTANNFAISKLESRHGMNGNPGAPAKAISIEQGAEWILQAAQDFMLPRI